jgi:hypothetical protein
MKTVFILAAIISIAACQKKPSDSMETRSLEIQALQDVVENYISLSHTIDSISSDLSAIERERAAFFLVSTYSLVMESYVEKGDPANPELTEWMRKPRKFAGDNPNTVYIQASVSADYTYKLHGQPGSAMYIGFQVYGYQQGFNLPSSNINISDIKLNEDGSFDLIISRTKPENALNWLPLIAGDHAMLIREYFSDRNKVIPSKLSIVRIDSNKTSGNTYLQRLLHANKMLTEYILGTVDISVILKENALNQYSGKDAQVRAPKYGGALYPAKDNRYEGCWVSLQKGQALKVHGRIPENTPYASYVFYDRWYNTPTYPDVNCYRTKDEIYLNNDGTFDLYISPEKIDHPNWLNTGGLYEGSYSSRYLQSQSSEYPEISVVEIRNIQAWK